MISSVGQSTALGHTDGLHHFRVTKEETLECNGAGGRGVGSVIRVDTEKNANLHNSIIRIILKEL